DTLDHLHKTQIEMSNDGVEVPTPVEHTTDPEKRRGTLLQTKLGKNSKGLDAIFGLIKFNKASEAEQLTNSDVSVFIPVELPSGNGKTYKQPIAHVAFTDYPVIPGLGKFELVASFTFSTPPETENMDKLAALLGVDPKAPDLEAALTDAIKALQDKAKAVPASNPPAPPPVPLPVETKLSKNLADSMAGMVLSARETVIDSLVGKQLKPAAAKLLKEQFCKVESLSLSFVNNGNANDESAFNATINTLRENGNVLNLGEKSGAQIPEDVKLSGADLIDPKKNPLIASAERMAAEAKR
ncbi:MAG TPA: hypothetical protein VM260_26950, partial [Pirellula sp.]|nr:hypothetical protein [Pirellula sp.]